MANKYIVTFKDSTSTAEIDQAAKNIENAGGKVTHRYDGGVLNGFAAEIPDSHFQSLQADSKIDYIEPDSVMTIQ